MLFAPLTRYLQPSLLLKEVVEDGGVLITTYDQMRKQAEVRKWRRSGLR